jgi:hypothetical protein
MESGHKFTFPVRAEHNNIELILQYMGDIMMSRGVKCYQPCELCEESDQLRPLGVGGTVVYDNCYDMIHGPMKEGLFHGIKKLLKSVKRR